MLKDILPPKARWYVYLAYALVGVTLTSIQAGFGAAEVPPPVWLIVAWAVFGVLGSGFGLTAAGNINKPEANAPEHRAE